MAAGIVYHNITTASGVTFSIACWVPNTATPDVGAIPVQLPVTSAGAEIVPATAAKQDTGNASLASIVSGMAAPGQQVTTASTSVVPASDAPPFPVKQIPTATANGVTPSRVNSAASNNLTSVKASAGQLYDIDVFNTAAYDVFLKFYNKASAPVVASDTPVWTVPVKAGMGYARTFPQGRAFSTGIAYAITKLQADTDATNVAAGDLTGSLGWI